MKNLSTVQRSKGLREADKAVVVMGQGMEVVGMGEGLEGLGGKEEEMAEGWEV